MIFRKNNSKEETFYFHHFPFVISNTLDTIFEVVTVSTNICMYCILTERSFNYVAGVASGAGGGAGAAAAGSAAAGAAPSAVTFSNSSIIFCF